MPKNRFLNMLVVSGLFATGFLFSFSATAKLYKWVDENGTTHYGETIPPKYADKDRTVIDKSGLVKEQEVHTPEELREVRKSRQREEELKRAEEQEKLEKKRYDKALVDSYTSVEEIELARKRNIQQIELRIIGINANIRIAEEHLLSLQKEASAYTNSKREIPESLNVDMEGAQARLDKLRKDLEKPQSEKEAMDARYEADKARYRELTGK